MTEDPRPSLLLAFNFPPHEGGIARMMGELARRYPPYSLMVSTGRYPGSTASDADYLQTIDRVPVPADHLRTVMGLLRWTRRADRLARRHRPRFTWCGELKPAAYPARWLHARYGVPYGIITYGAELLLLDEKLRRSRFKRWTGRQLLEGASVFVAISRWTADYTRRILAEHGLERLVERVRVVPLGTDPEEFHPDLPVTDIKHAYGLEGGPWILTVARLDWHKGFDTVIRALAAVRAAHPGARYAIAGVGGGWWPNRGWATPCAFSVTSPRRISRRCTTPSTFSPWSRGATICSWRASASPPSKHLRRGSPSWPVEKAACRTRCATARRGCSSIRMTPAPWPLR